MGNVILFGASEAGRHYILNQTEDRIIALTDNNEAKWGQSLEGIKIVSPEEASQLSFDQIIITSMYYNPIKKQLVEELHVPEQKVIAANKNLLKESVYPFEHEQTLAYANDALLKLCSTLSNAGIQYFIDFGTLLGIVRDDNLIRWDDDIDITCYLKDMNEIEKCLEDFVISQTTENVTWSYGRTKHLNGKDSSLVLSFEDAANQIYKFSIDIWLLYFEGELAVQTMNKCKKEHFEVADSLTYKGANMQVPKDYKRYLAHTYGDWETPKKDTTFAEYPFAFENE